MLRGRKWREDLYKRILEGEFSVWVKDTASRWLDLEDAILNGFKGLIHMTDSELLEHLQHLTVCEDAGVEQKPGIKPMMESADDEDVKGIGL
jgi:hypothetical protein